MLVLTCQFLVSCVPGAHLSQRDPVSVEAYVDRGLAHLLSRNYVAAKTELMKAAPFKTGDARTLMALGIAADMTEDFRLSDRVYEKLLTLGSDQATLFNNMGYSYMLRGDLSKAADYLAEAARRSPKDETIKNNLSMLKKVSPL